MLPLWAKKGGDRLTVRNLARGALFVAAFAVCAWLAVPVPPVPFTLQSLALFLCLLLLGGKHSCAVCAVYLLLGCAGVPVFSGFRGGIGALLGPTGGYLLGFLLCCLVYWLLTGIFGSRLTVRLWSLVFGWLLCYGFGTLWLLLYYPEGALSLWAAASQYVLPFLLPDAGKLMLALLLEKKLRRFV